MLAVLAFMSHQAVVKAIDNFFKYLPESIKPMVDYFEDNFIGMLGEIRVSYI